MTQSNSTMTGVLVLKQVTSVIRALFSVFELKETMMEGNKVYVANISGRTNCNWDKVASKLATLINDLELEVVVEDENDSDIHTYLYILLEHFKCTDDNLINLVDSIDEDSDARLDELFPLALAMDDGHCLHSFESEIGWGCYKPALFEFGGMCEYQSKEFGITIDSQYAIALGNQVTAALEKNDTVQAASIFKGRLLAMLAGINDTEKHNSILSELSKLLQSEAPEKQTDSTTFEVEICQHTIKWHSDYEYVNVLDTYATERITKAICNNESQGQITLFLDSGITCECFWNIDR